jgi:hypothetical protein
VKRSPPPESRDEWLTYPQGYVRYEFMERVAICMVLGGLNEQDAMRVAMEEERADFTCYVPGER